MVKENAVYLSIVIPAYNEEQNILSTFADMSAYLKNRPLEYEVIVVDDGSKDKTADIAKTGKELFKNFLFLKNPVNKGKGYSVKEGVLSARGDRILFMDADNSTRISQLDKLENAVNEGCDIAIGSRRILGSRVEDSQPIHRIILGNIYIKLSNLILGTNVRDYNCGFKLYTKKAAELLFPKITRNDWSFDSELIFLISKYALKIKEVPIIWKDKRTSKVKPLRDGIKSFLSLIKIRRRDFQGLYD